MTGTTLATLLLLEDDIVFARLLMDSLDQAGYAVIHAAKMQDALDLLVDHPIDLVITDVFIKHGMKYTPEGGLLFLTRLRASPGLSRYRGLPVIAISGAIYTPGTQNLLQIALDHGADRVLAKPFLPGDLILAVETLLGSGRVPSVAVY
ncbi:MAG: response regulator [Pseudomonadota bacterium]